MVDWFWILIWQRAKRCKNNRFDNSIISMNWGRLGRWDWCFTCTEDGQLRGNNWELQLSVYIMWIFICNSFISFIVSVGHQIGRTRMIWGGRRPRNKEDADIMWKIRQCWGWWDKNDTTRNNKDKYHHQQWRSCTKKSQALSTTQVINTT